MLRPALLAVALAAAAPALADCPRAADLDGGLTVTLAEGLGERLVRREGGRLVVDDVAAPGGALRAVYAHPLLVQELGPEAAPARYAYAADPAGLDALAETGRWESQVEVTLAGGEAMSGRVAIAYLGATEVEIGGCRYPAMEVREQVSFGWFLGGSSVVLTYAPDLGIVTGGAFTGDAGAFTAPTVVTMIKRR